MYKVPINVIVSPRVSAHLSFATKPVNRAEPFEKWSVDEVVDIVLPQKDPTYFLRPKKPPPPKNVANTTVVKKQPIKNEKHPKLLKALTSSTSASNQTTTSITTTSSSGDKTKSYNIAKLLSTTVTTPQQNTPVPKPVNTVTTTTLNQISQLRLPTRISSEVSLVPKSATVPKTSESISTFRLPILTQSAQPPQQRLPPPRAPPILPQQHSQLLPLPYIKEEPELTPQSPIEMPPHIQPVITPSHRPPPYSNMFRLPAPPIHNQHNQNELYLKQEKDIEENLSYPSPSQYSRPNINYQNHSYRMPLSKPASHVGYNHQPVYPTQQLRYRVAERKANAMINNQYYNTNHHQNGMRYRSVSGGSMMVLPNTTTNQNGGLLNQIPPPPTNLNSMPATHLLQSMNHMSNTLTHHSPLSHAQQNQVNSVYNQPNIGKMSPISSVPSPLHSIPSPIETKPLSSPINSMPSPLSNYNSSYNTSSNLYDHNYSDSFSNNSYSDSFSASYLQPQPAQQYIPPYSPHNHMEIDPFVDQMLQQAAGSNNNKTALRVKQPWELNQT